MAGKNYDDDNVFAKIIRGDLPAKMVAESPHAMAFHDVRPAARTHVLVVPKGPYGTMADFIDRAPAGEQADFWNLVMAAAEKSNVRDNFRLTVNTGAGAGQTVPHFHAHILSDK